MTGRPIKAVGSLLLVAANRSIPRPFGLDAAGAVVSWLSGEITSYIHFAQLSIDDLGGDDIGCGGVSGRVEYARAGEKSHAATG